MVAIEVGTGVIARGRDGEDILEAYMMWADMRLVTTTVHLPACVGEFVAVVVPIEITLWTRIFVCNRGGCCRCCCRQIILGQQWLILTFVEILDQEFDNVGFVVRKIDDILLGFLGYTVSGSWHFPPNQTRTFPPNLSARVKKSTRSQTMTLCTLYVSLPHVMVRSEYAPDLRSLAVS